MLINHEHRPAAASRGRRGRLADLRQARQGLATTAPGLRTRSDRAKAALMIVRMQPEDIKDKQRAGLGLRGHRRVLQDLHPRRLPDQPVRAADAPRAVPVPPVDLRPVRRRPGHLRPGRPRRCRSCRSASNDEGYLVALERLHRARRPELLGARMSATTSATDDAHRPHAARPPAGETVADWAGRPAGHLRPRQGQPAQDLPGPLVLHARRDLPLQLHHPHPHRRLPDAVLQAEHGARSSTTARTSPLQGHPDVRGLRLDACTSASTCAAVC